MDGVSGRKEREVREESLLEKRSLVCPTADANGLCCSPRSSGEGYSCLFQTAGSDDTCDGRCVTQEFSNERPCQGLCVAPYGGVYDGVRKKNKGDAPP